jgi:nitroreductase
MELYEAISSRRSIREYEGTAVERPVLERLIAAAGMAPSPHNSQPWRFHVAVGVTRDAVCEITALSTVHLQEYLDLLPPSKMAQAEHFFSSLGGAPVVIAVSVPICEDEPSRINAYLATGGAIQTMMLAAQAEGLGCCCLTFAFWVRDKLAALLGVEEDREIISLLLVGHPAETPKDPGRLADIATYLG